MNKRKFIVDCDPGINDALAIAMALARSDVELLGITTVGGNRGLEKTTTNTLRTLAYFGREDIPVYRGAEQPLKQPLPDFGPDTSHSGDGLGNAPIPIPQTHAASKSADAFLAETTMKYPREITLLAIGPLTNIARLCTFIDPSLVRELCLMNGAFWVPGNVNEYAEFNAYIDPEAADIVYRSGIPMRVAGLDVTNPVEMTREEFEAIRSIRTKRAQFFVATHEFAFKRKLKERYHIFWDPVAFLSLFDDSFIRTREGHVQVILEGVERGRTKFSEGGGNVRVGASVNAKRFFDYLYAFLRA